MAITFVFYFATLALHQKYSEIVRLRQLKELRYFSQALTGP